MKKFIKYRVRRLRAGASGVETIVMSAVMVLLIIGMYGVLKDMKVLENIIIWFKNQFVKGTSSI